MVEHRFGEGYYTRLKSLRIKWPGYKKNFVTQDLVSVEIHFTPSLGPAHASAIKNREIDVLTNFLNSCLTQSSLCRHYRPWAPSLGSPIVSPLIPPSFGSNSDLSVVEWWRINQQHYPWMLGSILLNPCVRTWLDRQVSFCGRIRLLE